MATTLKVTRKKSDIGCKQNQRDTMLTLGLRKIGQSVQLADTPQNRGYIRTVAHLVSVEEVK